MPSTAPNLLWIVTTQWRGQAAGFAGDPNARTPHLDQLAEQSWRFPVALTPHPFGPFARAALLTGKRSPANGVRGYFDPLPADTRTVAHALRERGYRTAHFGKWQLAPRDPAAPLVGEAHARQVVPRAYQGGFDDWEGFEAGFLLNDPWLQGTRLAAPVQFPGYQSDVLCRRAAEWIRSQQEGPWFCCVSLDAPHPPYGAPSGTVRPADPASIFLAGNVPRATPVEARARRELAGYYAHIEATDLALGRWLLQEPGLAEAAVVFTSVHGDMHGSHGLFRKGWPYEESVRVPLLVRPPGRTMAPTVQDAAVVSLLDVHAWTLAWAEGRDPLAAPGQLPTAQLLSMPSVVALPDQCDRRWRGLRTQQRKLIVEDAGEPWLFFNLADDPEETTNLANDPREARNITALAAELNRRQAGW